MALDMANGDKNAPSVVKKQKELDDLLKAVTQDEDPTEPTSEIPIQDLLS